MFLRPDNGPQRRHRCSCVWLVSWQAGVWHTSVHGGCTVYPVANTRHGFIPSQELTPRLITCPACSCTAHSNQSCPACGTHHCALRQCAAGAQHLQDLNRTRKGVLAALMPRALNPVTALLKWPLVAVTLLGFLGLLALQSFSLPDELPRAAIERLLGVDIAPNTPSPPAHPHAMIMPHNGIMAGHHMHSMQQGGTNTQHTPQHHHGSESCPLCPLLSLPAALPLGVVLVPPPIQRWIRRGSCASTPRGPPPIALGLPPSRGPPA